jgi:DNA-binding transcriptional LysR family regulator
MMVFKKYECNYRFLTIDSKKMNLKQLKYFCEIVEAGSARAAAQRLFVAPTALSMQLSQLEAHLGGALLDRATRPMCLTALGQFFYPKAKALLLDFAHLEVEARGVAAGTSGWLAIGFTRSTIFSILPEAVQAMQIALPDVQIDLLEILTEEQPAALHSGTIHVGIARVLGDFDRDPSLQYVPLFEDPLVVALPTNHPLATCTSVSVKDLQGLPYVSYPKVANAHFSRQVLFYLAQGDTRIDVRHEAKEIHTALGLVAAGLGVTVVGRSVAANNRADVRFIPIVDFPIVSQVMAILNQTTPNTLMQTFLSYLQAQVPSE